jgi:hypothetical protein
LGDLDGVSRTIRYYGKGQVIWGLPLEDVLARLGISKDCEFDRRLDADLACIHRQSGQVDIYYIANLTDSDQEIQVRCRITGKEAEVWDPDTGLIEPASYRIAMVIASCSGEGGAALSRRNYGETIKHLVAPTRYPYQFCANYQKWADKADQMPMDAHMLIALIAPRPVLLQTGTTDKWSDPYGEFLAAVAAGPVYRLLGKQDLGAEKMPPAGQPILHTIGFYMHDGGHGALPQDWPVFLQFMQMHLAK